jgi:uncharacterized protein (DUF934 family)
VSPPRDVPAGARVLTRGGVFTDDIWHLIRSGETVPASSGLPLLLPLPRYLAGDRPPSSGIWLAPDDDPAALAHCVDALTRVAVEFPAFADGRGYSIATLLRMRYGYRGDLRAVGDVRVDQLFALGRAGFSSFELRAGQSTAAVLRSLRTFSDAYQTSADTRLPAFRRCTRPAATELIDGRTIEESPPA